MHGRVKISFWARGSVGHGARFGQDACAHGRVHGSVATHGLVAHGLNFMGMIEPCGWFIGTLSCLSAPDRCVSRVGTTEILD